MWFVGQEAAPPGQIISPSQEPAAKWLLYCYGAQHPLDRAHLNYCSCINKLMRNANINFFNENIFTTTIIHRIFIMKALCLWVGQASLTNQSLIESELYEYLVRDIIVNKIFLSIVSQNIPIFPKWIEWRRLVTSYYDGGSQWLSLPGDEWPELSSINQPSRIRECNPATRDDTFRQATLFRVPTIAKFPHNK